MKLKHSALAVSAAIQIMVGAIQLVLAGGVYVPDKLLQAQASTPPPTVQPHSGVESGLTLRQMEVLSLMAQGLPNREIGSQLGVAEATIKSHVRSLFQILGVNSRTQAVLAAQKKGLIDTTTA